MDQIIPPNNQLNTQFSANNLGTPASKKSPAKIVLAVIIILALAGAGIYLFKKTNIFNPPASSSPSPSPQAEDLTDSDYDGLPDKIEKAIGTNPAKWDTDGDGYSDAVEIKSGYDPLVAGVKLSPENYAAIKEKIKQASSAFYDKFFTPILNPDQDFSTPDSTLTIFMQAIKAKNKDLLFKTLDKNMLEFLNISGTLKLPFLEITKGLENNFTEDVKYSVIDQNEKYAIMSPAIRKIGGVKKTVTYDYINVKGTVALEERGNIYLKNEDEAWKIDINASGRVLIFRNIDISNKMSEEDQKAIDEKIRNYWMSGAGNR